MYLVYYALTGSGENVREVHVVLVQNADGTADASRIVDRWFGEGYARVLKVEYIG